MQPQIHICAQCRTQHDVEAQFCPACGGHLTWQTFAPPKRSGRTSAFVIVAGSIVLLVALAAMFPKNPQGITPADIAAGATSPTLRPAASAARGERMVLDNAQVTAYVECTNREYKQYKFRFVVKNPGSPLIAPIVRMAGASNIHSVFVNGVDSDMVGFAFGPNIVVINKNLEVVPATYDTRVLNGNDALGDAYHGLVLKYERGN